MDCAVEASGLAKHYRGHIALEDVTAGFPAGRVIGLLGHNGAGKSTLIKLMLGLVRPTGGTVSLFGASPTGGGASRLRERVAYLPENVAFYGNLSGQEVLAYCAGLKGVATGQVPSLLERVGLEDAAGRRVNTYSKGMRQRLGVAQMLIGEPELLIMDEPTTGLDPMAIMDFYALVEALRNQGRTVIISSHLLGEIEPHLDHAVVLDHGRVVAEGDIAGMRARAGLPVHVDVRFDGHDAADAFKSSSLGAYATVLRGDSVVLDVPQPEKLAVLRALTANEGLVALKVREPSLSDLYARLAADRAQALGAGS